MKRTPKAGIPGMTYLDAAESTILTRHFNEWVACGRDKMPLEILLACARLEARGELKVSHHNHRGESVMALNTDPHATATSMDYDSGGER
jgi:hypothetical protein